MKIRISPEGVVKLLKPSLLLSEAELIADIMQDKFDILSEPDIEVLAEFIESITVIRKKETPEEYSKIKLLFENGIEEVKSGLRYDFIYDVDFIQGIAICGVSY